jgi:hypothetical protein
VRRLSETDYKDLNCRSTSLARPGLHYEQSLSVEKAYELEEITYCRRGSQFDCHRLLAATESASHVAGNAQRDGHADTRALIDVTAGLTRHTQHDAKYHSSVPAPHAGFTALAELGLSMS